MSDFHYVFVDSYHPNKPIGPCFARWLIAIGVKTVYSREDIVAFASLLSNTLKKRVLNLKQGSSLKIIRLHKIGDLMLRNLTSEEFLLFEDLEETKKQKNNAYLRLNYIAPEILNELSDLKKRERSLQTKIDKLCFV